MPLLAVAFLAGGASAAHGGTIDRDYSRQFPAPPGTRLVLHHGDGDVSVRAWDRPEIDIHIVYRGTVKQVGFGTAPDFHAEFRTKGKTVTVIGKESSSVNFGMRFVHIEEYSYTVRAPREVALELRGEDGDVAVQDWRGTIDCRLDDGDVRLERVESSVSVHLEDGDLEVTGFAGDLTVNTEDGDVRLEDSRLGKFQARLEDGNLHLAGCSGNLDAELEDGDVVLDGVRLERCRVRTEDGDVTAGFRDPAAIDLDLASADGNVDVTLDEGARAALSLHSDDGTIEVDLGGVSDLQRERGGVTGRLGDGSGRIRIRTGNGDIGLRDVPRGGSR